jgi:hypothetical protein
LWILARLLPVFPPVARRHDLVHLHFYYFMMHIMVRLAILLELVSALGAHVNQFFSASKCAVSELRLLVGDVLLALIVTAGTACSHSKQDCGLYHRNEPWLWMAQLKDVQPSLCH